MNRRRKRRVFSHINMDLDANSSVFVWLEFVDPSAEIVLVSASWDGAGMEDGDVALDITAGGRGIKGTVKKGVRHSCVSTVAEKYLNEETRRKLASLIAFIDAQDTFGDAYEYLAPNAEERIREMLACTGINAVLRSLQSKISGDNPVYQQMAEIFSGMIRNTILPDAPKLLAGMAKHWLLSRFPRAKMGADFEAMLIRHCSTDDMQALAPFAAFIKACETGEPFALLASSVSRDAIFVLEETSLLGVFRGLVAVHGNGPALEEQMFQLFDGFHQNGLKRFCAQQEADETPVLAGRVALLEEPKYSATSLMLIRHRKVDVVVYKHGNTIGVRGRKGLSIRMDHPLIRAATKGEEDWFAHEGGWLYARGTRKAPKATPSRVDPMRLAMAVLAALESVGIEVKVA